MYYIYPAHILRSIAELHTNGWVPQLPGESRWGIQQAVTIRPPWFTAVTNTHWLHHQGGWQKPTLSQGKCFNTDSKHNIYYSVALCIFIDKYIDKASLWTIVIQDNGVMLHKVMS